MKKPVEPKKMTDVEHLEAIRRAMDAVGVAITAASREGLEVTVEGGQWHMGRYIEGEKVCAVPSVHVLRRYG